MIGFGKKPEKLGITCFGLEDHELAVLRSIMERSTDLLADYELREPMQAATCVVVVVNQDSQLATSWWKNLKKRNPSAIPMFLTNSKQATEDGAYCKRPFSPSVVQAAFEDFLSNNVSLAEHSP